jgi:hypothetical protein
MGYGYMAVGSQKPICWVCGNPTDEKDVFGNTCHKACEEHMIEGE